MRYTFLQPKELGGMHLWKIFATGLGVTKGKDFLPLQDTEYSYPLEIAYTERWQ